MYKIEWDKETGGIVLKSYVTPETLGISPRPVFWEELDLLKLNEIIRFTPFLICIIRSFV